MDETFEALPVRVGFCIGIPGQPCGREILDSEVEAVELEIDRRTGKKQGVIGVCCWGKLFPLASHVPKPLTSSQVISQKRKAGRLSAVNNRLHVNPLKSKPKRGNRNSGNSVNIALPGSKDFRGKARPGPEEWRNYPK